MNGHRELSLKSRLRLSIYLQKIGRRGGCVSVSDTEQQQDYRDKPSSF